MNLDAYVCSRAAVVVSWPAHLTTAASAAPVHLFSRRFQLAGAGGGARTSSVVQVALLALKSLRIQIS